MMQALLGLTIGLVIGILYILFQTDMPLPPKYFPPRPVIMAWLGVQLAVHILFIAWIFARAEAHIKRLSAKHPTLGNFTNLKYTFTRFINLTDFIVLFALNLLAMLLFYLLAQ